MGVPGVSDGIGVAPVLVGDGGNEQFQVIETGITTTVALRGRQVEASASGKPKKTTATASITGRKKPSPPELFGRPLRRLITKLVLIKIKPLIDTDVPLVLVCPTLAPERAKRPANPFSRSGGGALKVTARHFRCSWSKNGER